MPNTFTTPEKLSTPLTYFSKFFGNDFFEMIAEQTNLYSCQLIGSSIKTNVTEMKAFIGMKFIMGLVKMPAIEDYWAADTRYDKLAVVMPLKRFKCLSRMLHFQDNMAFGASEDMLIKIRPVLDHMRSKCKEIEAENQFSVDEMMVPYKGKKAGGLRQYLPSKPKKWGFKMFVRAGVSGFVYDFMVYTGKSTFDGATYIPDTELGVGASVVLELCKTIKKPHQCVVYFDNFFTSLKLLTALRVKMGLRSLGTIRKNRLMGCVLEDDRALLRRGRGSYDYRVANEDQLAIVKWVDNKTVTLVSSCVAVNPMGEVKRYSKEQKRQISVSCPRIVTEYNTHMGGVDLADMMIALYRTPTKSHRWYLSIFWQLIDIALNNAWLLHRRDVAALEEKKVKPKVFRMDVAKALIYPVRETRGRPSKGNEDNVPPTKVIKQPKVPRPVEDMRYDMIDHFPVLMEKGRCRLCPNGQTSITCGKCKVRLCIVTGQNARNCFSAFHSQ